MEKKISEFYARIDGFEGGNGFLNIVANASLVFNEGAEPVRYVFPFSDKVGGVNLEEYRGKSIKVTVEVQD